MSFDPMERAQILELYTELWPGRVSDRKADLFLDAVSGYSAADVRGALRELFTYGDSERRPRVAAILEAAAEKSRQRGGVEASTGDADDGGDPISWAEFCGKVKSGEVFVDGRAVAFLGELLGADDATKH